ncbi:hypothetical protein J2045_000092 [Peteryoungia aggregata LMG 23059]|uniref:DUF3887 domain-containing protein n=1 Tax=Peteryoungia aggregata LMG 23059 TaxID=1368425 RepID=A0ABU0G188_9HYPH|nr:hypothetical protein [Peteryoungia aggregata]MDQ0419082.1 hypothetical protein [Peteryoungia aggregata LMG 23059]
MPKFLMTLASAIVAVSFMPAHAEPPQPDVSKLVSPALIEEMRSFINTEIVQVSVAAQNQRLTAMAQDKIDALDNQWKAEREATDKPLIAATLSNPLSVYLARIQGKSLGLYAEIFVMDQNGLNVGQSSVTSDFWQGDEDKFQKTYQVSDDAMFVDAAEWDDEAKIWRNQVSFTLLDASKKKIGAVTVEINLTELERRLLAAS